MTTYSTGALHWAVRTRVLEADGQAGEVITLADSLGEALRHLARLPQRPGVERQLVCRCPQRAPGRGWQAVDA